MSDNVYLNADKSAIVSQFTDGKKYQVTRAEAVKLGLLESDKKPIQERRVSESPLLRPEPEKVAPPQKRRYTKRK